MNREEYRKSLRATLAETPLLDVHTHLVGGKLCARGLHDILLYHMSISDLYAAGCPNGGRLTPYPNWPDKEEAHGRIRQALPYLQHVANTSINWGVRIILNDLYEFSQPLNEENWERLDARIREKSDDPAWHEEVIRRARIQRFCTEIARREQGQDDAVLQYSLEWGFFTRCQWGEFDTALYELERCWGKTPESPAPIGGGQRPSTDRVIKTLTDVHEAIQWYVDQIPADKIISTATHLSTDIDYRLITDSEMERALGQRDCAGVSERDAYASYINEAYLTALEKKHGDKILFQFSFGAEPLPQTTSSRIYQRTLVQLAEMVARHLNLQFQCFLASAHANQTLCTFCRDLPNLSLSGFWWHNFFPTIIERVLSERLDMLPTNKQVGFFSDAYCIEWAYAKAQMVRRIYEKVLLDKIDLGQYDLSCAVDVARSVFYRTPQTLNGMTPAYI